MAATTESLLLSQILDQLGWIRLHLQALIVVGVGFVVVLVMVSRNMSRQIRGDFSRAGQALLDREKYQEVVDLGTKHLSSFPGDAPAQWLVAQAHFRLGNHSEALTYAKKAQQLQPDWESLYTGPFISYVEQELVKSKSKPGLKVVTPSSSMQPTGEKPPAAD
jgi:tetratricopeptide (TPR) repeat protein